MAMLIPNVYSATLVSKNEAQKQLGIFTVNSLLKVQFNVPKKCYEFKSNTELKNMCKCYEHTLVCYFHEIGVGFCLDCCQKKLDNTGQVIWK